MLYFNSYYFVVQSVQLNPDGKNFFKKNLDFFLSDVQQQNEFVTVFPSPAHMD